MKKFSYFVNFVNFIENLLTSRGTNEPKKVIKDQNETPNIIIHFLGYLSPK